MAPSRLGPLPITAYTACNGLGTSTDDVLSALEAGRHRLVPPPLPVRFDTVCGVLPDELPALPATLASYDCREARIALLTLDPIRPRVAAAVRRWGADRVAVIVATTTGGIAESERAYAAFKATGRLDPGYDFDHQHAFNAVAECVSRIAGARGPAYVVSTACSSSGKVLLSAQRLIAAGVVDAALVGGVDSLALTTVCGFAGLGVLASGPSRPFSGQRSGMNVGEGGAMLLLEREGDGPARLLGGAETSDAHHMSSPHPDGRGARDAMRGALAAAGLGPQDVDHINAHGTATAMNDAVEAAAIENVLGRDVPVVSTKGYTGHMLGAAGATEAIFAVAAVEHGWLPPSLGSDPVDPAFRIRINLHRTSLRCDVAMSNSLGFGGSNVSLLFGRT